MEPDEVFEGNLGELVTALEAAMEPEAVMAVRTVIAVMLTLGVQKFDTRMVPDMCNEDVRLRVHNAADAKSWSVEVVNSDELKGGLQ